MSKRLLLAYEGHPMQFNNCGWFNATIAAERFGKVPYEWLRLPDTVSYIQGLERKYGKIPYYTSRRGKNGGTWIHPKLGVTFARWLDVDFAIWCDEQIELIIHGDPTKADWTRLRHEAASTYKVMTQVLLDVRRDAGKETAPYHFMNEARLVNQALTGKFEGLDRESLSIDELDLLAKLEARNAVLIARGADRDQRKGCLANLVIQARAKQIRRYPRNNDALAGGRLEGIAKDSGSGLSCNADGAERRRHPRRQPGA